MYSRPVRSIVINIQAMIIRINFW